MSKKPLTIIADSWNAETREWETWLHRLDPKTGKYNRVERVEV